MNNPAFLDLQVSLSNYLEAVNTSLNKMADAKFTLGPEDKPGTEVRNIYQLEIGNLDPSLPEAVGVSGDPVDHSGVTHNANVYVHLKLPANVLLNDWMYRIEVQGYSYESAKIIDCTYVGYAYQGGQTLYSASSTGTVPTNQYSDVNGNVILSFLLAGCYRSAFQVSSMVCGIGPAIKRGMIECKLSHAAQVAFAV